MPSTLAATGQSIAGRAKSQFGEKILAVEQSPSDVVLKVDPTVWRAVHQFLKDDGFDLLHSVSAVDWIKDGRCWVVTHLFDTKHLMRISVKTEVPRDAARVDSLAPLWSAANWHERECFDLSGVTFDGHPDLRRILCPDDWVGHALRKDYKAPDHYHGIVNNVNLIDLDNRQPLPDTV